MEPKRYATINNKIIFIFNLFQVETNVYFSMKECFKQSKKIERMKGAILMSFKNPEQGQHFSLSPRSKNDRGRWFK